MDAAPNWFSVIRRQPNVVDGICSVIDDTATSDRDYSVTIEMVGIEVYARETRPGEKLPRFCYDRHIMSNGWFCVGLNSGNSVTSDRAARDWWCNLSQFLRLQGVAATTGRWPRAMELDHGHAGTHHQAAIEAAAKLGVAEEYELALLGERSWIQSALNRDGTQLLNGRAPCPMGCTRKGRRLLRRKCCSKETVLSLVKSERSRARASAKFWNSLRANESFACCGTMINCPLNVNATSSA